MDAAERRRDQLRDASEDTRQRLDLLIDHLIGQLHLELTASRRHGTVSVESRIRDGQIHSIEWSVRGTILVK